jgi:hypothetical protein
MPKEQEADVPLSAIHINLSERSITFEADDKPVAKLTFSSGTIYFNTPKENDDLPATAQELPQTPADQEKEKTITLTGKLLTKPKEGRKDRSNKPTAYARFAAHEEGQEGAHIYLASFHRAAANIALNLNKDVQITVNGYPHLSEDAKRMDTLSVINIIQYPGKLQRQGR